MRLSVISLFLFFSLSLNAQDKPAYRIFNPDGKKADYEDMIMTISKADVVFIGELHDDPIAHWLELEITKSLHEMAGSNLLLGAEMFEADNQLLLNEYLGKTYDASKFEAEAKLWKNYKTDYKPLVEFARSNGLPFIATNIPRRYASVVNKSGFEGLTSLAQEARRYIAPLPVEYDPELKCYKDMLSMGDQGGAMAAHVSQNLPKAQAIKDATMAYFIHLNMGEKNKFIHYNGSYHSRNYEGIVWYLRRLNPRLTIATVETVRQKEINKLDKENYKIAGFIIAVPESMTRTY